MDDWNFIIQSLHLLQMGTPPAIQWMQWLSGASYQERRGPVHPRRERRKEILRGPRGRGGVWCLSHGSCHGYNVLLQFVIPFIWLHGAYVSFILFILYH